MPPPTDQLLQPVVDALQAAQDAIDSRWAEIAGDPDRWRERRRLRGLQSYVDAQLEQALTNARAFLQEVFPSIYASGGTDVARSVGGSFSWNQAHLQALAIVSQDTFDRLLVATQHVSREVKLVIRQATKAAVTAKIGTGTPAVAAGRNLARALADQRIAVVTYRNGARVPVRVYSQMVMRTESALAYNLGTLNTGRALGITVYEVLDGPDCGWVDHSDPELALGKIVGQEEAEQYPIAHPSCRRTFGGRPDLQQREQQGEPRPARGGSVTRAQTIDQANFDRAARLQQGRAASARRAAGRTPRTPRR